MSNLLTISKDGDVDFERPLGKMKVSELHVCEKQIRKTLLGVMAAMKEIKKNTRKYDRYAYAVNVLRSTLHHVVYRIVRKNGIKQYSRAVNISYQHLVKYGIS